MQIDVQGQQFVTCPRHVRCVGILGPSCMEVVIHAYQTPLSILQAVQAVIHDQPLLIQVFTSRMGLRGSLMISSCVSFR
jgi:hypothetical protein